MQAKDTLYNKYRPQKFADIIGQNHIRVTLQNEVATNKLAHAYIFTGPRGVGKTSVARLLAKTLNCEKKEDKIAEPCNECQVCQDINDSRSMDLIEIDAASQTKVEQTRENIIAASRVTASAGRIKIFIIDEVHMLSSASFNALLKTLEEPPAKVVFILATTEIHKVPETIVSRCQRFDFHRIGINDLVKWMDGICTAEKYTVKKDVLTAIAKQSEGGARDALSLLGQVLTLGDGEITFDQASLILPRSDYMIITQLVDFFINNQSAQAITLLNKSLDEGVDLSQLIKDLIEYTRQLLLLNIMGGKEKIKIDMDKDSLKAIREQSDQLDSNKLIFILDTLIEKWQQVKLCALPQLPIEIAFIKICLPSETLVKDGGVKKIQDAIAVPRPEVKTAPATVVKEPDAVEVKAEKIEEKKSSYAKASDDREVKEESKNEETSPADPSSSGAEIVDAKDQSSAKASEVGEKKTLINDKEVRLDDIKDKWTEILRDLKGYNHSLSAFMKVARPIKFENNEFVLGFQYSFHLEVLEDLNKKKMIEDVIGESLGVVVTVKGLIDEEYDKREVWEVNNIKEPSGIESDKQSETDEAVDVVSEF